MPASSSTGLKAKLTISRCDSKKLPALDGTAANSQVVFEAPINPSGYESKREIQYATESPIGQSNNEPKYASTPPEEITLKEFILDGTGVVPGAALTSVREQIESLCQAVYEFVGDKHETPIVRVSWGPLLFYGRLRSMKIDYTLFKPNGEPLRAKVSLSFIQFESSEETARKAAKSSPDLTHRIEVKAGDTLPLLCYRIYNDCSYYPQVARINNLTSINQLQPGQLLMFPPLQ